MNIVRSMDRTNIATMGNTDSNYIQYSTACRDPKHRQQTLATQNSNTDRAQMQRVLIFTCSPDSTNASFLKMGIFKHGFNTTLLKVSTCASTINWGLILYDLD